jgi:outer membrane protein OmpA-like peptidoglycan-associated protein
LFCVRQRTDDAPSGAYSVFHQLEELQRRLVESQRQVVSQQLQARDAETRTDQLQAQLRELAATKTDRGVMITFGDLLFDTDMAQIKPDGMRDVQKLANVLNQYPGATY